MLLSYKVAILYQKCAPSSSFEPSIKEHGKTLHMLGEAHDIMQKSKDATTEDSPHPEAETIDDKIDEIQKSISVCRAKKLLLESL